MIDSTYLKTMALYNQWQNETLFKICDRLSDEQRRLNRGMYFDSIFNTLNHVIYVDQLLQSLIHTKALPKFEPDVIPYVEYSELKAARADFDQTLVQTAEECSEDWLNEQFEFWSERLNRHRKLPRSFYYMQMFNHQTHHRSQVTAEFHKMGIDYGSTDLPYNPYYDF
jgi:uncharacterized damage-inducible protein DinB